MATIARFGTGNLPGSWIESPRRHPQTDDGDNMQHRSYRGRQSRLPRFAKPTAHTVLTFGITALIGSTLLGLTGTVLARGASMDGAIAIPFGPSLSASGWQAVSFPGRRAASFKAHGTDTVRVETAGGAGLLWRRAPAGVAGATKAMWRWRKALGVGPTDLSQKGGDDRLLAVYFAFADPGDKQAMTDLKGLLRSGRGDILMYVWGGGVRPGTIVKVPYFKGRGRAIVKRQAAAPAETWFVEDAALAADFQRAFGKPPGRLVAIALSSDADDTGGHNIAALADLYLK